VCIGFLLTSCTKIGADIKHFGQDGSKYVEKELCEALTRDPNNITALAALGTLLSERRLVLIMVLEVLCENCCFLQRHRVGRNSLQKNNAGDP
jgi:hypothetical protein